MLSPLVGLHHVTAIASSPQHNLDFYTEVLGLRFVKRTVNFDDPGTYHFYFGDDLGSPGTILTFFPWPGAVNGIRGAGETIATAFNVPASAIPYWERRLIEHQVKLEQPAERFGDSVLSFFDPDGMKIEMVGHADAVESHPPRYSPVPPEHAVRGFSGVTLLQREAEDTVSILYVMGFKKVAEENGRLRFAADGNAPGNNIDVIVDPAAPRAHSGAGSVHHIAFRVKDDAAQLEWREELSKYLQVTTVQDRTYFHSIYFREPGGVLFEIATDPPGFALDEPVESLGEELRIPEWLEPQRQRIEAQLAPITLHKFSEV